MNCLLLGATRGCGLQTTLQLLSKGHNCYLLVRSPETFTTTVLPTLNLPPEQLANLHLIQGDALDPSSIRTLFTSAPSGPHSISFILFSLGGRPSFYPNPLHPKIVPEKICSRTINIFLPVFKEFFPDVNRQPRLVVISSSGIGKEGHGDLPGVMKPMYGWFLKEPHADKEEMEKVLCREAGIASKDFNPAPPPPPVRDAPSTSGGAKAEQEGKSKVETDNKDSSSPSLPPITLGNLVIIRPALLTDGVQTQKVRCAERLKSAYTISRKDVGWFIVEECFEPESKWKGKAVTVAY